MVEVDESILGPDAPAQFFPSDEFARALSQRSQDLEGLLLAANASAILAQHSGMQIQFVYIKPNGRSALHGRTHGHLAIFVLDDTGPEKVLIVNDSSCVLADI